MSSVFDPAKNDVITIRNHLLPGDMGSIVYLHGILYAEEHGFDHTFEAYVAGPLSEFINSGADGQRIWLVEKEGIIKGSSAMVRYTQHEAQLRWLLLHPDIRGHGIGRYLVEEAIKFCRERGYESIFLWTVSTLKAAAALYKSVGFEMTAQNTTKIWGNLITEERYDLVLK